MSIYALHIDDLDKLGDLQGEILAATEYFLGISPAVFEEFRFVVGSGYGERVVDEIELVLCRRYHDENTLMERIAGAIRDAGLDDYAKTQVLHLSTGWQKYLSIVLFAHANADEPSAVMFAPFHYLDDVLATRALSQLEVFRDLILVDYDVPRLRRLVPLILGLALENGRIILSESGTVGHNANW